MRNLVVTLEIFDIVSCVKLLAKVLAHLIYFVNSFRESDIGLLCILEANRAQDFKLLLDAFLINDFLLLVEFDTLLVFTVRDAL